MAKRRRRFTSEFKCRMALAMVRKRDNVQAIAARGTSFIPTT